MLRTSTNAHKPSICSLTQESQVGGMFSQPPTVSFWTGTPSNGQGARHWHIFIKEVAAAVRALQICSQKNSNLVFTVFMDNIAAEHAVGRGFSSNTLATSLMKGANLEQHRYYTRRIDTKWSPSDGPSRGFAVDATFTARVCADLDRLVL